MKYANAEFEFTRGVQPANYETTKATGKLSVVFEDDENPDIDGVMQDLSERVQSHVLAAVGLKPEHAGLAQRVTHEGASRQTGPSVGEGPAPSAEKEANAGQPAPAQGSGEQSAASSSGRSADDINDSHLTQAAQDKARADGTPDNVKAIVKGLGLERMTQAQGETRVALYEKLIGER